RRPLWGSRGARGPPGAGRGRRRQGRGLARGIHGRGRSQAPGVLPRGLPPAAQGLPADRDSLGGMGGSFQRKQDHSALQERIAALTQPMPEHETALVDFEKRSWLSAASAKVLVGIVAVLVIGVGAVGLLSRSGGQARSEERRVGNEGECR